MEDIKAGNQGEYNLDRKFYALAVFGVTSTVLLILIIKLAIDTQAGIRGYVAGEAYWAKAQKESVIHLTNYIYSGRESDYHNFNAVLRIIEGDKLARLQLMQDDIDMDELTRNFITGLNHPEDIPEMVTVIRRFRNVEDVQNAINAWEAGDNKVDELKAFADSIHSNIDIDNLSLNERHLLSGQLVRIDHELTELEMRFSGTMNSLGRKVSRLLIIGSVVLVILILISGTYLSFRFRKSAKVWGRSLEETEKKFVNVLSNSRDVLYKMRLKDRTYEFVSPAIKDMLGYDVEEFEQGGADFILDRTHPEDIERMNELVEKYKKLNNSNFMPVIEFRMKNAEGDYVWVSNTRNLVTDENGQPEAIVGSVRDITEKKQQDVKIKKSLEEKEVLLQEIHHRVKNNLSIISSMLELQKASVDESTAKLLSESQSRIHSIAKVHQKLYQSENLADISMKTYCREICDELLSAYTSEDKRIEIDFEVDDVYMEINQSIYTGLVINELISNAFKHGFKNHASGKIQVTLRKNGEGLILEVANNGEPLPADYDPYSGGSLGMTLVKVLSDTYNGELSIETGEWTRFRILFSNDES